MTIKVNGETQQVEKPPLTMTELLTLNKVEHPELVSVQLNGQFLDSKLYNTSVIQENDEIEFLYFLGGGGRG